MDDPAVFTAFVQNVLAVNILRARNEIVGFCALLLTSDTDLDRFVLNVHSLNLSCPAVGCILIPNGVPMHLKSLHFELADRERCDALPAAPWLQALLVVQLTCF